MSVHENDQTVSHITILGDPTLASVSVAESAVAAFKLALKELGELVPANDVRAVLTTSGLRLEVTAAPTTTVEHYGTPAPVEDIAEFIGDEPKFADGDTVRVTGNSGTVSGAGKHSFTVGDVLTLDRARPDSDGDCFATRDSDGFVDWIRPADFERVA